MVHKASSVLKCIFLSVKKHQDKLKNFRMLEVEQKNPFKYCSSAFFIHHIVFTAE